MTDLPDPRPNRFELCGERRPRLVPRPHRASLVRAGRSRGGSSSSAAPSSFAVAACRARRPARLHGFEEWATVVSSGVSGALIIVGVVRLRHHRLAAYRWFERGILVQIFVTQVFEFAHEQLDRGVRPGVQHPDLWIALRSMIRAEHRAQSPSSPKYGRFLDSSRWPRRRNRASTGSRTSGRPGGTPTGRTRSTARRRATTCTRSTPRRRRSAVRSTSVTCSRTRTPTPSPASSACAGARSSIRWDGTTTASPPSGGCRTTSGCAAIRRCPSTPRSRRRRSRASRRSRSAGRTSWSSAIGWWSRTSRSSRSSGAPSASRSTGR